MANTYRVPVTLLSLGSVIHCPIVLPSKQDTKPTGMGGQAFGLMPCLEGKVLAVVELCPPRHYAHSIA